MPDQTTDHLSGAAYEKLVAEETLIFQATEAICERMEEDSETATRNALAKKLGRSKGFVSQILSGDRNMTLRTLAQFADALGCTAEVTLTAIPAPPGEKPANNGTTVAVHSFPGIDGDWVAHLDSRAAIAAAEDKGRKAAERERDSILKTLEEVGAQRDSAEQNLAAAEDKGRSEERERLRGMVEPVAMAIAAAGDSVFAWEQMPERVGNNARRQKENLRAATREHCRELARAALASLDSDHRKSLATLTKGGTDA